MKVLLVRPPVPKHTIGLKNIMICEPLELEYVAARLDGHELMIFDGLVEKGFDQRLRDFKPDVVVSSCYKTGVNEVIKVFRKIKEWNLECVTVVGGVHATLVPQDFHDSAVDIIGMGDGTLLLKEIVSALEKGDSVSNIPGLAIPLNPDELFKTEKRKYMEPADNLPLPRRDLIKHLQNKYYYLMHQPVVTMKTTWGCWYKCNFCFTWKITDGNPYSRSPESIVEELKTIEAKEIYIVDDIFLINKSRLAKLATLLRENNIHKHYLVYARADFIAQNEDIIAEWAGLGLTAVFIGLEAVTDSELDQMNKESPATENIKAIEVLKRNKIDTYGSLIPGQNYLKEDWDRLWKFIQETGLYYVNISPITPLPGTDIWNDFKGQLTVPEDAHGLFDLSHMLLPTKLSLKAYYRELLSLYQKTIFNLKRAKNHTYRTLPSVWSIQYYRILRGSLKIRKQFLNAHKHHSAAEIKIAQFKGAEVPQLTYKTKLRHPSFKHFVKSAEPALVQ
tara:strand:+ start:4059 stop:5570 length:1512 start_codon:yes stop_codon:yes gene_type:complete